ncbi:MAG TPA: hypothetical protein DCE78_10690 [Bacteroidetes bacterium]|jgi:hypothetical protein|nr:hypothetical protein [Bacteroidota bacterium]
MGLLTLSCVTPTSTQSGVASAIVEVLRDYNQELPIGFVARMLGQDPTEIDPYLIQLENKRIIKRNGITISLVTSNTR